MANFNKPNSSQSGMNFAQAAKGQFGAEFASETNAQKVRQQNEKSAKGMQGAQGQFGTEFASETDAAEVRQQNQQSEAHKAQNAGQFGNQS